MKQTLEFLSGLQVISRKERGISVFEFMFNGRMIKTCFTYPKAKLFAEGVDAGKKIKDVRDLV